MTKEDLIKALSPRRDDLAGSVREQLELFISLRKQFPEASKYPYVCNEDLVLKHGDIFYPAEEPPPVSPVPRACFAQCYRLTARKNSRWIYCEGYGLMSDVGLLCHHAWVTSRDQPGKAVDLAWSGPDRIYMGICFKREFVMETYRASKRSCYSVLGAWWQHYPLLTGKLKLEDMRYQAPARKIEVRA